METPDNERHSIDPEIADDAFIPQRQRSSIIPKVNSNGIMINWKIIVASIVVAFGGGGGTMLWSFASEQYVDQSILDHTKVSDENQAQRDRKLNATLELHERELEKHGLVIGEVRIDVSQIQRVQHQQIARAEARRATESIRNRQRREREYDRLYQRNLARLESGRDPCATVDCGN